MKRKLALVLVLVLAVSMFAFSGCSEKKEAEFKIGMVTDTGGVNDQSFNQSSWKGLEDIQKELGDEKLFVKYLESKTDADYKTNIETFIDEDYDLIICVGFMLANATKEAATAHPDQKFAIIDDDSITLDNVACLMFEQAQASYLVGYVAGKMTESNTVGFVIGSNTTIMNQFGYGYLAGVYSANPDATVLQYNANAFGDPATGKTAAVGMVDNGADIIFHAAGGTGSGVIEACKDEGIWAIGVDSDQSYLAPDNVLTSAMKRVDIAVQETVKDLVNGKYTPGVHRYDLASSGVDLAPTTTHIPAELLDEVQQLKKDIIDGKVSVPKTKEEFEALYGDKYELDE